MTSGARVRWAYLVGATLVGGVVAGLSVAALRYEAEAAESRREAAHRARVRLALWRVESQASMLIGRLSALSYANYAPAYAPAALYTRKGQRSAQGRLLVEPSPVLLADWPAYVRLHFQAPLRGQITSPQVPQGSFAWVKHSPGVVVPAKSRRRLAELRRRLPPRVRKRLARQAPPLLAIRAVPATWRAEPRAGGRDRQELALRRWNVQQNSVQLTPRTNPEAEDNVWLNLQNDAPPPQGKAGHPGGVRVRLTAMRATWIRDAQGPPQLLVYRVVEARGQRFLQGAWIDWPGLARELRGLVSDLFPKARFRRVPPGTDAEDSGLASLPVALVAPFRPGGVKWWTPSRIALYLAWLLVLVVLGAGWFLVRRAVDLGTRRMSFVSAVSHELRTPLTAFRMYLDLLADDVVADPSRRREVLLKLRGQAERLGDLVGQVLDFARLERRALVVRPRPIEVGALAQRLVERCRERCDAAGVELERKITARPEATLHTDPDTLEHVVLNLVDNACKYGVEGVPEDESVAVRLHIAATEETLIIRVSDPGPGVPHRERKRIFEPFYRAGDEMTRSQTGVGLGLALARRSARGLGGELILSGELRRDGTHAAEFTLTVPGLRS